jgi:hypothetical protein
LDLGIQTNPRPPAARLPRTSTAATTIEHHVDLRLRRAGFIRSYRSRPNRAWRYRRRRRTRGRTCRRDTVVTSVCVTVAEHIECGIPYEDDEESTGRFALQAPLVCPAGHRHVGAVEPESPRPIGPAGASGDRGSISDPCLQIGDRVQTYVQIGARRRRTCDIAVVRGEQTPAQEQLRQLKILAAQWPTRPPPLWSDEDREPGQGHADSHSTSVVRRETVRFTGLPRPMANP